MDGLILVDKPPDLTSHDVVLRVRGVLGVPKVGHFGTLDPMATGLLLVAVGKITKLFSLFSAEDKTYTGTIRFGFATDSYDATGVPTSAPAPVLPGEDEIRRAMTLFVGEFEQLPPALSAKKFAGRPLYRWTRERQPVVRKPVRVRVDSLILKSYAPPEAEFECRCSAGTYVRSLAHELGLRLGCGAHLSALRRIASGSHSIDQAHPLADIECFAREGRVTEFLLPPEKILPQVPRLTIGETARKSLCRGRPIPPPTILRIDPGPSFPLPSPSIQGIYRIQSADGRFIGLARVLPDLSFVPFFLLESPSAPAPSRK